MSAEKYTKNVLMKGFIFPAIYQMHVVLNFLNNHEKQKNQQNHSFISEAKQKVKKKNSEFESSKDKKEKMYVVQARAQRWMVERNILSRDSDNNDGNKDVRISR